MRLLRGVVWRGWKKRRPTVRRRQVKKDERKEVWMEKCKDLPSQEQPGEGDEWRPERLGEDRCVLTRSAGVLERSFNKISGR